MKTTQRKPFAKHVARIVCTTELTKRGIQFDPEEQLLADKTIEWIGDNIRRLPDILQPWHNVDNQSIFYSKDAYRQLEQWKASIRAQPSDMWWWDVFKLMALTAYQSHIWLDSQTPKGVPDYESLIKALAAFKI